MQISTSVLRANSNASNASTPQEVMNVCAQRVLPPEAIVPTDSRPTVPRSCAVSNGFCSHVCTEEWHSGVQCSCHEGFHLLRTEELASIRINAWQTMDHTEKCVEYDAMARFIIWPKFSVAMFL
ncbi:hypothetical protein CEXT_504021 [Caerostris extrusa]|uniref:Uncharacterized protein n=1 Tax=Caerostris extrusa TaxID=172846 RepID=A0AAV4VVI5_CAEEX|nr:hypothetical protein CEXT_504021 [Caerostris extrusa]